MDVQNFLVTQLPSVHHLSVTVRLTTPNENVSGRKGNKSSHFLAFPPVMRFGYQTATATTNTATVDVTSCLSVVSSRRTAKRLATDKMLRNA